MQALKNGSLTVYPEYLNTFNTAVAGYRHGFRTLLDAYDGAEHYALSHGMQVLAPTPFSDTSAIAVTVAYAAQNHVRGIGDLAHLTAGLTLGGPPQFQQGTPGLPALNDVYGFVPIGYRPMAVGDQYSALNNGAIQAAEVNNTDGQLATGDYAVLRDPRRVFGWGNVVPVVSAKAMVTEGPAFADTIQRVNDTLTTATIRQLNYAVSDRRPGSRLGGPPVPADPRAAGADDAVAASASAGAESGGAALGLAQELDLDGRRELDADEHELGDAGAGGDLKCVLAVGVEEQHTDLAAVARVDEAGRIDDRDAVAGRQARAGQDQTGLSRRDLHGDARGHRRPLARCQHGILQRVEVEAGVAVVGSGGEPRALVQARDAQGHPLAAGVSANEA